MCVDSKGDLQRFSFVLQRLIFSSLNARFAKMCRRGWQFSRTVLGFKFGKFLEHKIFLTRGLASL